MMEASKISHIFSSLILVFILTFSLLLGDTMSIYDFKAKDIDGKMVNISSYKNKTLLIVNVASECAFTPQYEGLEKLYQELKDTDFMILAFPSNQFMNQEPRGNEQIKYFCTTNYNVSFDMFAKIDVNGENTHPLYKFLKKEQRGFLWTQFIKWNFTKFLVDKDGNVIKRYSSVTKPKDIKKDILKIQ